MSCTHTHTHSRVACDIWMSHGVTYGWVVPWGIWMRHVTCRLPSHVMWHVSVCVKTHDAVHWKCYVLEIHQIEKLTFLRILRYKFKLKFRCDLNVDWMIWVSRFGEFRGRSIFREICHCFAKQSWCEGDIISRCLCVCVCVFVCVWERERVCVCALCVCVCVCVWLPAAPGITLSKVKGQRSKVKGDMTLCSAAWLWLCTADLPQHPPRLLYLRVYVCVCMYAYMRIYVCVCMYAYMRKCMRLCVCAYVCVCKRAGVLSRRAGVCVRRSCCNRTPPHYRVALVSRIDQIIGLFCKRAL